MKISHIILGIALVVALLAGIVSYNNVGKIEHINYELTKKQYKKLKVASEEVKERIAKEDAESERRHIERMLTKKFRPIIEQYHLEMTAKEKGLSEAEIIQSRAYAQLQLELPGLVAEHGVMTSLKTDKKTHVVTFQDGYELSRDNEDLMRAWTKSVYSVILTSSIYGNMVTMEKMLERPIFQNQ